MARELSKHMSESKSMDSLESDPEKSRQFGGLVGSVLTILVVVIAIVAFMVNAYSGAASDTAGQREGMWAVIMTSVVFVVVVGAHQACALRIPGFLRWPIMAVVVFVGGFYSGGMMQEAKALPAGQNGMTTGIQIVVAFLILATPIGFALWRVAFRNRKKSTVTE